MKLNDKFEKFPGVYVVKNLVNGKYYIGESLNIRNRIYQHKKGVAQLLHKAIKKYGIENFDIYVEYLKDFGKNDLIELEECLIMKYDSLAPNGYNICLKGSNCSGIKQSDESKLKRSKSLTGIKRSREEIKRSSESRKGTKRTPKQIENISNSHKGIVYGPCSEERKRKISESLKLRYKNTEHPFQGKKHTEEFKKNLSAKKTGISNLSAKLPILQIDINTGEVIKEWESTSDAVLSMFKDKKKASSISAVLHGRYKTAHGYRWKFKN